MSTIEFRSQVSLDELINAIARLETPDLEQFIGRVLALRARRTAANVPDAEAELLERVNQGIPIDLQQRYNELNAQRQSRTLTPEQHEELLMLIERVEEADADRVQALAQLAQLRNISVGVLMDQLNIRRPPYA